MIRRQLYSNEFIAKSISTKYLFLGECHGISLTKRGKEDPHICIQLLTEDDGYWSSNANNFSSFWLPEFISVMKEVEKWLSENAEIEKDGYGWKFKK